MRAKSVLLCVAIAVSLFTGTQSASASGISVLMVVDTSGSMRGDKIEDAKSALHTSIGALDDTQAAGLRSYAGSCGDGGILRVPIGVDNREALHAETDSLYASGGTPTPDALRAAAGDFPVGQPGTVVLISDGQSGCGDPCPVAEQLAEEFGVEFKVHTVGFQTSDTAENELQCIADATGGVYVGADDEQGLVDAIGDSLTGGSCPVDATLVSARGSGDNDNGTDYPGARALSLAAELGSDRFDYDVDVLGVDYPAVDVAFRDWVNIGSATSPTVMPEVVFYFSSVDEGEAALLEQLADVRNECGPDHPILLMGYSQGAHVVQNALETMAAVPSVYPAIDGVILQASPRLSQEDQVARGTFGRRYGGGLAGPGKLDERYRDLARSWCLAGDPVCGGDPIMLRTLNVHTSGYQAGSAEFRDAVGFAAWAVGQATGDDVVAAPYGEPTVSSEIVWKSGVAYNYNAASVYSDGAPSKLFFWDFENDGVFDEVTREAQTDLFIRRSNYIQPDGPAEGRVSVHFADGAVREYTIPISSRPRNGGR